jgi:hypothetical protein
MPASDDRVKVILMEWAAYPPHRDKVVGKQKVRCGLARILDSMRRYDPGLPVDVTVVINSAGSAVTTAGTPNAQTSGAGSSHRNPLQRWRTQREQRRITERLHRYAELPNQYPFVQTVCFRDNSGQDFGAYDFGYQLLQGQGHRGDVLFMNSSVAGPFEHGWLSKYRDQFYRHPNTGLCGIALNSHNTSHEPSEFAPHVQSYFLYTNMGVLKEAVGKCLLGEEADSANKLDIIQKGEIGVSQRVLQAGYGITSAAFPEFAYRNGDAWSIPTGDLRYSRKPQLPANTI